jgi:hypothetical protein
MWAKIQQNDPEGAYKGFFSREGRKTFAKIEKGL